MKNFIFAFSTLILLCTLNIKDCVCQWVKMDNGLQKCTVFCFTSSGTNLFAGTNKGVFMSSNSGYNWVAINDGLTELHINALLISGSNIFAGTYYNGVYVSTNNGTNWTAVNSGLSNHCVYSLISLGTYIFAGTNGGAFRTSNNGVNWISANNGITDPCIFALTVCGSNIFAGTMNSGVFISSNNGTNWLAINTGLTSLNIFALTMTASKIYAGTWYSGIFITTNNGTNWSSLNNPYSVNICDLMALGNYIVAGDWYNGIALSQDAGINWISVNSGLGELQVRSLYVYNYSIYCGTINSIWRRPLSELIGINNSSSNNPDNFYLFQNYPNPFNATSIIKYQIKEIEGNKKSEVRITVYDIAGKEIETLVNERLQPGTYEAKFDGSNLPSGIYFYQLKAGDYIETKKMLLIK